MVERLDECAPGHPEPAAQIIPHGDAELAACLGEAQEGIAAITAGIAACPSADLPARDITTDVILRAIGVKRDLRAFQHHQQLGLVGMQPRQQAIQRDEAGAATEDPVEPRAQCEALTPAGIVTIRLEAGVEVPNQTSNLLLRGALGIVESVQLVHQPFGVHPAQGVSADVELPGVIAQDHGLAQAPVGVDAASQRALGGEPHWVWRDTQRGQPEPVEMRQPARMIGKPCL